MRAVGNIGEEQAALYLAAKGYDILERQFRSRFGEIDLIVRREDLIAFVEVKLRKDASWGTPGSAVTPKKQQKLRATALYWQSLHPEDWDLRFDVIEVYAPQGAGGRLEFVHIENAFV